MIYKAFGYSIYLPEVFAISDIMDSPMDSGAYPYFKVVFKSDFGAGSELHLKMEGLSPERLDMYRKQCPSLYSTVPSDYDVEKLDIFSKSKEEYLKLVAAWEKVKLAKPNDITT